MARPIRLTEELITKMTEEFSENLRKARMSDGKISYTKQFTYPGKENLKANIWFSPMAYMKMWMLISAFTSEVAWHGTVERLGDNEFLIKDILVYPQEVSGATVNTDQEGYQQWLMALDDDTANTMHMQGHSHVYMKPSPSGTDLNHQEEIIKMLDGDGFYIFMIWNKNLEHNIKVYDFKLNTLYEDADCNVGIIGEGTDLSKFIQSAKALVTTKYTTNYGSGSKGYTPGYGASNYSSGAKGSSVNSGSAKNAQSTTKGSAAATSYDDDYDYSGLGDVKDFDDYVYNGRGRIGFHQERLDV